MVWEKGAVPHEVYARQENPGMIVTDRYDITKNNFLNDFELANKNLEKQKADDKARAERPGFVMNDRWIDDWTGSKWANHPYTYGVEPFPPKSEP
jgi:hypothetical protein